MSHRDHVLYPSILHKIAGPFVIYGSDSQDDCRLMPCILQKVPLYLRISVLLLQLFIFALRFPKRKLRAIGKLGFDILHIIFDNLVLFVSVSCFNTHQVEKIFRALRRDPCAAKEKKETKLRQGKRKVQDIFVK